jgi:hypothetical protein
MTERKRLSYSPDRNRARGQALYRQARLLGVLLLLQVIAMVGIGVWLFSRFDWNRALNITSGSGKINVQTVEGPWLQPLVQALLFVVYFLGPVILLLLAGLGFVLLRRRGWMLASVAQALIMLACLFFYGASRPWFAYPIIAYSIFMILLLNSRSVRAVVHRRRLTPTEARAEIAHGE